MTAAIVDSGMTVGTAAVSVTAVTVMAGTMTAAIDAWAFQLTCRFL
jgi:hypothetical protein